MARAAQRVKYDPYRNINYAYDGSAVRVLEQEEVLQPKPRRRTAARPRVQSRPRVQVREAGKVSLFAVSGFAAVAVMAVLILLSYVQLNAISSQVVSKTAEMSELQSEEASLRAAYEQAYDLQAIEAAVTADGSMGRPQAGQVIYVDLTEPDSVVRYDRDGEAGSFLDGAKEIVQNILAYF